MTDVAAEVPAQADAAAASESKPADAGAAEANRSEAQPAVAGEKPAAPAQPATAGAEAPATPAQPATAGAEAPATPDGIRERAGAAIDRATDAANEAVDATRQAASRAAVRIRNNATLQAGRGRTTIANEVVEKIAGIAAREVPGVYDLGGDVARLFSSVREKLHLGDENQAQGVSVHLEGKNAEIEVIIVIEFGFQVYSVTEAVREKVVSSVESMLGLDVTAVNVNVDDVHIDDDSAPGNDAERAIGYSAETKAIVVGAPAQG